MFPQQTQMNTWMHTSRCNAQHESHETQDNVKIRSEQGQLLLLDSTLSQHWRSLKPNEDAFDSVSVIRAKFCLIIGGFSMFLLKKALSVSLIPTLSIFRWWTSHPITKSVRNANYFIYLGLYILILSLGLHDISFQHRYHDVHIHDSYIAGCAIFSILIVFSINVHTGGDKATVANPMNFVSVRHKKNKTFTVGICCE